MFLEKSNFFVKLPEKIEIFRKFSQRNRLFWWNCLKNRIFFTRIHDPPVFKPEWRRCLSPSGNRTHRLIFNLSFPQNTLWKKLSLWFDASSHHMETGPGPPTDYSLEKPSYLMQRSWISWCPALGFEWRFRNFEFTITIRPYQGTSLGPTITVRSLQEMIKPIFSPTNHATRMHYQSQKRIHIYVQ